jgi:hypothetical protein
MLSDFGRECTEVDRAARRLRIEVAAPQGKQHAPHLFQRAAAEFGAGPPGVGNEPAILRQPHSSNLDALYGI